jgi:small basic protein (TIGR04137 family)
MAIHPSLRMSDKDTKQRTVLKRTERLKTMMQSSKWKEGDSVFGLPKIKTVRIKIKKEKVEKAETAATPEGAAPAAATAAPEAKEQAAGKAQAAKTQEKK